MDPNTIPLEAPPPGVIPNFVDPPSQAFRMHITVAVCFSFMIPCVGARIYSKGFIVCAVGWEDCESSCLERNI